MGPQGIQGEVGPTGPTGPVGEATGGDVVGTFPELYLASGSVDAAKIADRVRHVMIPSSMFTFDNAGVSFGNSAAAAQSAGRSHFVVGGVFRDCCQDVATTIFVVPADYVPGQALPSLTLYYAVNGTGNTKVHLAVSARPAADFASNAVPNVFRAMIRQNASGAGAYEAPAPATGALTQVTVPLTYGTPALEFNPGDTIVVSVTRHGSLSFLDPNTGDVVFHGIGFSYIADQ